MAKLELLVDELGALSEEANKIKERMDEIKAILKEKGAGEYQGKVFKAEVRTTKDVTYDKEKIAKKLGFEKYIIVSEPKITETRKYLPEKELQKYILEIKEDLRVYVSKLKK